MRFASSRGLGAACLVSTWSVLAVVAACGSDNAPSPVGEGPDGASTAAPTTSSTGVTPAPSASGDAGGGDASGECYSGQGCPSGQMCVITNGSAGGVCTALPASCGPKPTSPDCMCAAVPECHVDGGNASCSITSDEYYLVACGQTHAELHQEGEVCSESSYCANGLHCLIPTAGGPGTCVKNPASCAPADDCTCIKTAVISECPGKNPVCDGTYVGIHLIVVTCK